MRNCCSSDHDEVAAGECPGPGDFISDALQRRSFFKVGLGGMLSLTFAQWLGSSSSAAAEGPAPTAKNVILLWMNGGPSHVDTWDPKPGTTNGGPFKAIKTSVPGIEVCEHLPRVAECAAELSILRGMTSREGNHQRAQYLLHTGYAPLGGIQHPTFGAVVSKEIGDTKFDLPNFVSIRGRGVGAGFLGTQYAPFVVNDPTQPVQNLSYARGMDQDRFMRRVQVLSYLEQDFGSLTRSDYVEGHKTVYGKAVNMMHSPLIKAFDLSQEPVAIRQNYGVPASAGSDSGDGPRMMMAPPMRRGGPPGVFAAGCLMARRLVESGVKFVEVVLDGWDTHDDNFGRTKTLMEQFDSPMAALIKDLKQRGLLKSTLVIWMGEFGRTPRINAREGRDHFPNAWSAVLAGGGVRGGQVIGQTNEDASRVVSDPIEVGDFFASLCRALGINQDKQYFATNGRPLRIVDKGKVVEKLFG